MPSEEIAARILAVLEPAMQTFRSAVTDAADAVRAQIEAQRPVADRAQRVAEELGAFAAGRIDIARFAELLDSRPGLDAQAIALLERARTELTRIAAAGEAPFRVRVPSGGDLVAEVGSALAVAGRAFCAARMAELVRLGRMKEAAQEDLAAGLPFARWTRGELRIAPPLLVEVDGADLQVGGLAAFLDGAQTLVLMVRPPAPPAALARLITPNVLVMQTREPADVERLSDFDGPAIVALVPAGCATFAHDPSAEPHLEVKGLPAAAPVTRIGRASPFQQNEELALLRILGEAAKPGPANANAPANAPAPANALASASAPESADRLAAWLLQQADLAAIA